MNTPTKPKPVARALPGDLTDVALIAGDTCAAVGDVSLSWWQEEVRAERAPKPVIQLPRFSRWRLVDVRRFWAERATQPQAEAAALVKARAKKASDAASVKRERDLAATAE